MLFGSTAFAEAPFSATGSQSIEFLVSGQELTISDGNLIPKGGVILTGGNNITVEGRCKDGYFLEPTVIEGLAHDCRTNQEEIFGPVVTLNSLKSEDEVIM